MKKTILIDLDCILVDFYPKCLKIYNEKYKPSYYSDVVIEDIKCFDLIKNKKINGHIYKVIEEPGFFKDLPPIDGAIEAYNKMKKAGHEIIICSKPSRSAESWTDKIYWIKNNLKIKSNKNIILTGAKNRIIGDVLIDDGPKNQSEWLETNPKGIVVQINWPYNLDSVAHIKAESYKDTKNAWKIILENIL